MKRVNYKRVFYSVFSVVVFFSISWCFFDILKLDVEDKMDFYLGTVSVFIGALMAFYFNRYKDVQEDKEEKKKQLSYSLYIVSAQLNVVANLKKRMDEYGHLNAFNLKPSLVLEYPDLKHNPSSLSFILTSATPHLLSDLNLEQQSFELIVAAEKRRSEFVINELQPKFEEQGLPYGFVRLPGLEAKIGPRLFGTCVNEFRQLHALAAETCVGLERVFSDLRGYAVQQFPDHTFMNLKVDV